MATIVNGMFFTPTGDAVVLSNPNRITPKCTITFNGTNITGQVSFYLLSIVIHEMSSHNNDTVTIKLNDGDGITAPYAGASIGVQLGYAEDDALVDKGTWQVDEFTRSSPPKIIEVTGRSFSLAQAGPNSTLKTNRDDSYDSKSLDDIHQELAGRNALPAITDPSLSSIQITHRDQNSQSDMAFLTHLADDYGGIWKVQNGQSIICPLGQTKSISGQDVTNTTIDITMCISYKYTSQGRSSYAAVQKQYHDTDGGQTLIYELDNPSVSGMPGNEGNPAVIHKSPENYQDQTEAAGAAQSTANALQTDDFTFEVPGIPELAIDCLVNATGFSSEMPTAWVIIDCTHDYKEDGYITKCSCQPQGGFGTGAVGGTSMPIQPGNSASSIPSGGSQGDQTSQDGNEGN